MGKDVSFMQYLRAHGNTPGPTDRPYLNGAISGLIAEIPAALALFWSGALESAARFFGLDLWLALAADALLMIAAGMLYAFIFKRAANDPAGGWLFGAGYGFLLWMLTPVALWQLISSQPVITGRAAIGLFGARLLYGLVLGLLFPQVHGVLREELKFASKKGAGQAGEKRNAGKPPLDQNFAKTKSPLATEPEERKIAGS